jgi:hypothetical protein
MTNEPRTSVNSSDMIPDVVESKRAHENVFCCDEYSCAGEVGLYHFNKPMILNRCIVADLLPIY